MLSPIWPRSLVFHIEPDLHDGAKHSRGKLHEPDLPDVRVLLLNPEMRRRIQPVAEQPLAKENPAVQQLFCITHANSGLYLQALEPDRFCVRGAESLGQGSRERT
jgi:hypothetical protein